MIVSPSSGAIRSASSSNITKVARPRSPFERTKSTDLLVAHQVGVDLLDRRELPVRAFLRHEHPGMAPLERVVVAHVVEVPDPAVDPEEVERGRADEVDRRGVGPEERPDLRDPVQAGGASADDAGPSQRRWPLRRRWPSPRRWLSPRSRDSPRPAPSPGRPCAPTGGRRASRHGRPTSGPGTRPSPGDARPSPRASSPVGRRASAVGAACRARSGGASPSRCSLAARPQPTGASGGHARHPTMRSSVSATASSAPSRPGRAWTWRPIGRPSSPVPIGSERAGKPPRFAS